MEGKKKEDERNKNETKRKRQGCDSVFSACASFPQCVRHQCGLQERAHPALAHPASSAAINLPFFQQQVLFIVE